MADHLAPQGFDYSILDSDKQDFIRQRTAEIRSLMHRTTEQIILIGEHLQEVKARLDHGQFGRWLEAEFDWDIRTAQRLMRVAERFKNDSVSHLHLTATTLYLLAAPSTPDSAVEEVLERAGLGEPVTYATALGVVRHHTNQPPLPQVQVTRLEDPTEPQKMVIPTYRRLESDGPKPEPKEIYTATLEPPNRHAVHFSSQIGHDRAVRRAEISAARRSA